MAGELLARASSGWTLYALLVNRIGQLWRTDTHVFEAYDATHLANYTIALAEQGASGRFVGNMPSQPTHGLYYLDYRRQVGGAAAESDIQLADLLNKVSFAWTGTEEVEPRGTNSIVDGTITVGQQEAVQLSVINQNYSLTFDILTGIQTVDYVDPTGLVTRLTTVTPYDLDGRPISRTATYGAWP